MNLKYTVQTETNAIDFHVNPENGSLVITRGSEIEVPHIVAIELIETLRQKLYAHQEKSESLLNKLFK